MDESSAGLGIIGHEIEIIPVGASGFGFLLSVEALRQSSPCFRLFWLNFQRAPESFLSFIGPALTKGRPAQVLDGRDVIGIQMEQRFEGFRSPDPIPRTLQRNCQKISWPALCRKQFHHFAKRGYSGGVFLLV